MHGAPLCAAHGDDEGDHLPRLQNNARLRLKPPGSLPQYQQPTSPAQPLSAHLCSPCGATSCRNAPTSSTNSHAISTLSALGLSSMWMIISSASTCSVQTCSACLPGTGCSQLEGSKLQLGTLDDYTAHAAAPVTEGLPLLPHAKHSPVCPVPWRRTSCATPRLMRWAKKRAAAVHTGLSLSLCERMNWRQSLCAWFPKKMLDASAVRARNREAGHKLGTAASLKLVTAEMLSLPRNLIW